MSLQLLPCRQWHLFIREGCHMPMFKGADICRRLGMEKARSMGYWGIQISQRTLAESLHALIHTYSGQGLRGDAQGLRGAASARTTGWSFTNPSLSIQPLLMYLQHI